MRRDGTTADPAGTILHVFRDIVLIVDQQIETKYMRRQVRVMVRRATLNVEGQTETAVRIGQRQVDMPIILVDKLPWRVFRDVLSTMLPTVAVRQFVIEYSHIVGRDDEADRLCENRCT